jgi:transcriptional regulator with XRE-family HTH domain
MISAEQIRAARALLDWSTADLAKLSGLTVNGINKIEREYVNPQKETADRLQKVFEDAEIEFLPSGVKRKASIVQIWEDDDAGLRLFDDMYYTLRDVGGIVRIYGIDQTQTSNAIGRERIAAHIDRLRKCNVTERMIIKEGDTNFVGPLEAYHRVPARYFTHDSLRVYGTKVALAIWDKPQKIVVINDARMAESVRNLFDFVWDHTPPARRP